MFSFVKDSANKIEIPRLLIDALVYNFLALRFIDEERMKGKWDYNPDILPQPFYCKHLRIVGNSHKSNKTAEIREVDNWFEEENEQFRDKIFPLPSGILSLYLEVADLKSKYFTDKWLLRLFTTG